MKSRAIYDYGIFSAALYAIRNTMYGQNYVKPYPESRTTF